MDEILFSAIRSMSLSNLDQVNNFLQNIEFNYNNIQDKDKASLIIIELTILKESMEKLGNICRENFKCCGQSTN